MNWLECKECITKNKKEKEDKETQCTFTHLTDLPVNTGNIVLTSRTGRLRWKIENEGFNALKNGGYKMKHKYSRVNYQASKNYYQLMVLSCQFQDIFLMSKNHPTLKSLWQDLIAAMKWAQLDVKRLQKINRQIFALLQK